VIVPVIGMHRSGTSALAGVLSRLGVMMGEDRHMWPRPSEQNPKGFYENYRFRKQNDRILAKAGYDVRAWRPEVPEISATPRLRRKQQRLVRKYDRRYPIWGFKDPRTCLTLDLWLDAAEEIGAEVRAVFIARHPYSVARSMVKRGNTDHDTALGVWCAYNRRALQSLERREVTTLAVGFEGLLADPEAVGGRLADFLSLEFTREAVAGFIDDQLNRSSPVNPDWESGPSLPEPVAELAARIRDRMRPPA
jgi:hypothetical protein